MLPYEAPGSPNEISVIWSNFPGAFKAGDKNSNK